MRSCMGGLYNKVLLLDALVRRADVEARGAAVAHLAAGESVIKYKTRTAHSEALIVRGTGYDVVRLDQPRAGLSFNPYRS